MQSNLTGAYVASHCTYDINYLNIQAYRHSHGYTLYTCTYAHTYTNQPDNCIADTFRIRSFARVPSTGHVQVRMGSIRKWGDASKHCRALCGLLMICSAWWLGVLSCFRVHRCWCCCWLDWRRCRQVAVYSSPVIFTNVRVYICMYVRNAADDDDQNDADAAE
jgi:hypothetical protein